MKTQYEWTDKCPKEYKDIDCSKNIAAALAAGWIREKPKRIELQNRIGHVVKGEFSGAPFTDNQINLMEQAINGEMVAIEDIKKQWFNYSLSFCTWELNEKIMGFIEWLKAGKHLEG